MGRKTINALEALLKFLFDRKLNEYKITLDKMKKGEPTCEEQGAIWTDATMPRKFRNLRR